ncbi:hypothetical protein [Polaribacter sp. IC073]|uniref:hypothetical protein n=1 Tax=Polaribacter sp. IC073 TaxID=2508540 RepID=UPI0011BEDD06|nr:hypothetical protein [Polaribacter sp. IC073]TXD49299.1 hypothetical protein ES045_04345 [Polaribacter sp. IC073]
MKKKTLLLILILVSTFVFSQNKQGGNDLISGIDIIIKKNPGSQPIVNKENNPLISQINKSEFEYLNLKAREVQNNFAKQDLSKLKTKEEVLKAYITYLSIEIKELQIKINANNNSLEQQSLRRRKAKQHIILPDPKTKN